MNDKIDKFLLKECNIEKDVNSSLKYRVAREVAEKMQQNVIDRAIFWIIEKLFEKKLDDSLIELLKNFEQEMKGGEE